MYIGRKGSGSIYVSDVGGDFTVDHKGSGSIDYARVAGHVDVPGAAPAFRKRGRAESPDPPARENLSCRRRRSVRRFASRSCPRCRSTPAGGPAEGELLEDLAAASNVVVPQPAAGSRRRLAGSCTASRLRCSRRRSLLVDDEGVDAPLEALRMVCVQVTLPFASRSQLCLLVFWYCHSTVITLSPRSARASARSVGLSWVTK